MRVILISTALMWFSCGSTDLKRKDSFYHFKVPDRISSWTISEYQLSKTGDTVATSLTSPDLSETFDIGYFTDGDLEKLKHTRSDGYHSFIHKSAKSDHWMYMDFHQLSEGELPIRNCVSNEESVIIPDEITCFWVVNRINSDSIRIEAIHPMADSVNLYLSTRASKDSIYSFQVADDSRGVFRHSMRVEKEDTVTGFFRFFKPAHDPDIKPQGAYAVHTTFFKYPNDYVFDAIENHNGSFSIIRKGLYAD
jgi:hypothetical protein